MNLRVLIIGLVWPEPTSSAACWRMLQLIEQLQQISCDVHFACAAQKSVSSHSLSSMSVKEHEILLNHASFDAFIEELNPDIVVYDRFMIEEQFGWRVKQICPNAVTVLDTEDLHFVRKARTTAFKLNSEINYDTVDCYRELSAIYRCDLSLIISKWEHDLLVNHFNIPPKQLMYLPFVEKEISDDIKNELPGFNQRKDLMFIGNFIHDPNYQTVLELKKMWSVVRKKLPKIQLHVYGAYPTQKVLQLHNEKEGFIVKGKAANVNKTMQKYRLLVAPIPYGAGLKGKFIDGFKNALPNITTPVGAESMLENEWGGSIVKNDNDFIEALMTLYSNQEKWQQATAQGFRIINDQFSCKIWGNIFSKAVATIYLDIKKHRNELFVQKILWQNSLQATKYMSLWIEQKNK